MIQQRIHNMLAIAVAIAGQPLPPVQDGELYREFMAYRRLGQYVATGALA